MIDSGLGRRWSRRDQPRRYLRVDGHVGVVPEEEDEPDLVRGYRGSDVARKTDRTSLNGGYMGSHNCKK